MPAYRAATAPVSAATSGVSTALGADHPTQRLEAAGVLGGRGPRDHEAVDVLPGEPHLDAHPRLRVGAHRLRDGVVEGPVEMSQRYVNEHPRDRVDLGPRTGFFALGGLTLRASARTRSGAGSNVGCSSPSPVVTRACFHPGATGAASRGLGPDSESAALPPPGNSPVSSPGNVRFHWGPSETAKPQTPAAALSLSARSVRSQVKSGSSRPKWP